MKSSVAETSGKFNYLQSSVHHSLYRNGEVLTRRDRDGSDAGTEGVLLEERSMSVVDARHLQGTAPRTCEANGFELMTSPLGQLDLDFFDHQQVVTGYYAECAELVKASTGAAQVFAFDHNVRSAQGKESKRRISGGQQVQGPAHVVHGDYTLTSAPQRLKDLANPPGLNDALRSVLAQGESLLTLKMVQRALDETSGRFGIINVWRNIVSEPVITHPLALCDAETVNPQDLVVFEIHYHDRIGENYFAKYAESHRWYYYPEMTRDEALLIKQWDSDGQLAQTKGEQGDSAGHASPCTFSFHSAFGDPNTPDNAPDRWSIEVRCIVVY